MPSLMLSRLRSAICDKGSNPRFHDVMEAQHRREWPVLWEALDEVMRMDAEIPDKGDGWYDALGKFHQGPNPYAAFHGSNGTGR